MVAPTQLRRPECELYEAVNLSDRIYVSQLGHIQSIKVQSKLEE